MFRMSFFTYLAVIASIYVVVTLLRKWRRAWAYRGLAHLPGPPREKWSKGHIPNLYNPNTAFAFHDSLSKYGPVAKNLWNLGNLRLYINDPYAMGEVLLKEENGWKGLKAIPRPGLLATRGAKHKAQRKIINQFSIHPLSAQVSILVEAHTELTRIEMFFSAYSAAYASRSISQAGIEREIKEQGTNAISVDIFGWATGVHWMLLVSLLNQICCVCKAHSLSGAPFRLGSMGHDFQTLSGVESDYSKAIKHLLFVYHIIAHTPYTHAPSEHGAIITRVPSKAIKQLLSIVDIQYEQALRIFSQRRAALTDSKHGHHNLSSAQKDVVTLILQANGKADPRDRISEEEMLGQLKSTRSLGKHYGWYASQIRGFVQSLIIDECTWLAFQHPPVTIVERVSSRDTVLPLRAPMGVDAEGRPCTALAVPAGTLVMVGLRAANRDPATWGPDAHEWNPRRWLEPLPQEWPTPESQRPDD
ncbi:Cytochrome p450 [Rhizoctonia solani]|uniref:Cytochrome p450 n=1 Tax=Rhizoctonia solani TaxID=456999 RepID=A0A8H7IKE9_9AGAM|nr:Cytochrome p450 [Rhizoctonia solani]